MDAMTEAFPDALVSGFEALIPGLHLPDPNDRHVLAAAIIAGAEQIVTNNLRDFPADVLAPYGIEPMTPDSFLINAFNLYPEITIATIRTRASELARPAIGIVGVLEALRKSGAPQFADAIADAVGV